MKYLSIFVLFLITFLTLSCNTVNSKKLRIGYVPIAVGLPIFVAVEEGYFKEEGFEVEMFRFASSNEIANAATSGQINVFMVASNVIFDVGFVSKKKHKLIITNPYSNKEGNITDYILVNDTNSIKNINDLRGKKIGVFPGSVIKVFVNLILERYGLDKNSYQLIELQPKDWAPALQSRQIDVLSALEPQASQLVKDKIGFPIVEGFYAKLMPDVPLSGEWISEDYLKNNSRENISAIIRAVDKAVEMIRRNPDRAKKYLAKYANVRNDILSMVELNPWPKHSEINYENFQNFIDILFNNGAIQNKENIDNYTIKLK